MAGVSNVFVLDPLRFEKDGLSDRRGMPISHFGPSNALSPIRAKLECHLESMIGTARLMKHTQIVTDVDVSVIVKKPDPVPSAMYTRPGNSPGKPRP